MSDGTNGNEALNRAVEVYNGQSANTYHLRSPQEIAAFFTGLDLVEPGVVSTASWRPDPDREEPTADVSVCGVAVKS
ncbi:SAM-dependent methyltransferase [Streptomyces sp. NPDC021140]|uniref:SAM-dependent methyltransferase n=1 Tax=Streptomyces sp. NPDC021140 TaxID=3365116 RepID=UPI00216B5D8B